MKYGSHKDLHIHVNLLKHFPYLPIYTPCLFTGVLKCVFGTSCTK